MNKVQVTTVELADLQRGLLWLREQIERDYGTVDGVKKIERLSERLDEWMLRSAR